LVTSSRDYFKALMAYDGLARSLAYVFLNVASFACFVWGAVGTFVVIWHAVQDETECSAGTMRFVAHAYAFIYIALMLWSLISVVLWLGGLLLTSETAALFLVRRAWHFDENYSPSGLPVLTLLVRALLLRDSKDRATLEACILRSEIEELSQEQQDLRTQEDALSNELGVAERHLAAATKQVQAWQSPDELADEYTDRLKGMVDKAAIVSLALSRQVQAHGPEFQAQLQASSEAFTEAASKAGAKALAETQELAAAAAADLQQRAQLAQEAYGMPGDATQLQERAAELAEMAQRRAQEAGLGDVSDWKARAAELAQEAGLQDLSQLQNLGSDSLKELAYTALLRAQAVGLNVEELVEQAMSTAKEGVPSEAEPQPEEAAQSSSS
jgi:hypothetical protein